MGIVGIGGWGYEGGDKKVRIVGIGGWGYDGGYRSVREDDRSACC